MALTNQIPVDGVATATTSAAATSATSAAATTTVATASAAATSAAGAGTAAAPGVTATSATATSAHEALVNTPNIPSALARTVDLLQCLTGPNNASTGYSYDGPKQKVTLLGATGSIGDASCSVLAQHPERYEVHGLVAYSNHYKMLKLIKQFRPARVAMFDEAAAAELKAALALISHSEAITTEVLAGEAGVIEVAGDGAAQIVIGAIVGAAGLKPLLAALKTGARIALANKEALVMSGQLFFAEARKYGATILPVDSEHSAIFQCLPPSEQVRMGSCELAKVGVREILLTGSGGPFRNCKPQDLVAVTPAMAVNHPVWSMGPKISVDSATMMNKALEFIEVRYLFNASAEQVKVLIHPQAVIHSMVSYTDGAVMAQLGSPDMRTPVAVALAYPERIASPVEPLDFTKYEALTFKNPNPELYPCLYLGMQASSLGQGSTTALNAANEIAVAAFLEERLGFTQIAEVVAMVLEQVSGTSVHELEEILALDSKARELARAAVIKLNP